MTNKILTVTALTRYIKHKFETDQHLKSFWLKGEISNFKHHNRGHMYLTIKDQGAQIQAVMFQGYNRQLTFTPENGMDVIVRGEVSVYEVQGKYQLYIQEMQPDGVGALHLAFEQLKEKLEREGLFDPAHKKMIPPYPEHIAVLTARTGAAVRDILSTLKARYPIAKVTVYQTLVQGANAKEDIVKRLKEVNDHHQADVIILGRGGGSIEDLWPFNEEDVARAVFSSEIPVISGVGHETDFTMTDFVSDYRAPTPTGAAVKAVPELTQIKQNVNDAYSRLQRQIDEQLLSKKEQVARLKASYAFKYPKKLIFEKDQQLDQLLERLSRATKHVLAANQTTHDHLAHRLGKISLRDKVTRHHQDVTRLNQALDKSILHHVEKNKHRFFRVMEALELISPLKTMQRGYSLIYKGNASLVKSSQDVQVGETVNIKLAEGKIEAVVQKIDNQSDNN
ncbi:exodeoxyribonuclease 7 large subunit [Halolactibacillus miurensis]|uniref:Exodeoxyribonuclease 7 large subunit n=1 Tax=Halolactibacillus miurensis TaxID=306541 RepID=A0A1I6PT33_9BACI|nr:MULTISPECIES: exodeoxyribonuclease VII large subunit [Halolactibacillus]GEM04432.1 exodeoxyribonuclease 7 large subunit [Halolactibacillus miurensis]SFS43379.1 exodeoxyribonuclease VII large subunit [Halolactibacillus miurensis]